MLKVVIDTNVYISAFNFGGIPYQLLILAIQGYFKLYTSEEIVSEVIAVLAKKFKYNQQKLRQVNAFLRNITKLVHSRKTLVRIRNQAGDNRILECALETKADYLASGDRKHILPLKKVNSTKIVNPKQFLEVLRVTY